MLEVLESEEQSGGVCTARDSAKDGVVIFDAGAMNASF